MKRFEYKYINMKSVFDTTKVAVGKVMSSAEVGREMENHLNELGSEGWELVSAVPIQTHILGCGGVSWSDFVLKREVPLSKP